MRLPHFVLCMLPLLFAPAFSGFASAAGPQEEKTEPPKNSSWEYAYETLLASAYVWRGLNLLGEGNQHYSPGVYLPSFSAACGIWTLGWASALQLGGSNLGRNVDAAAGMEQNFYLQAEKEWKHGLSFAAAVTLYGFPASRKNAAGADSAAYIEPAAGASWAWKINWIFKIFWFHGIQEALQSGDYAYFYTCASKEWEPAARWNFKLQLEGGGKWYLHENMPDNVWDVQLSAGVKRAFSEHLSCGLQAAAAWSDFSGKSFIQETALWMTATMSLSW